MTQPQDKMRAEFAMLPLKEWEELEYWLDRCLEKGHLDRCSDLIAPLEALNAAIIAQSAACAQQSAQSQQDALGSLKLSLPGMLHTDEWDSARVGDYNNGWNDCQRKALAALDAAIATQGASNV